MWGFNKKYVSLLESELAHYRALFEAERARADRLHDSLLVMHGELPATDTVIVEKRRKKTDNDDDLLRQQKETIELFAEAADEHSDLIPPGMLEQVKEIVG
jgi:hypothetical protein